jgi:hypothetical protein
VLSLTFDYVSLFYESIVTAASRNMIDKGRDVAALRRTVIEVQQGLELHAASLQGMKNIVSLRSLHTSAQPPVMIERYSSVPHVIQRHDSDGTDLIARQSVHSSPEARRASNLLLAKISRGASLGPSVFLISHDISVQSVSNAAAAPPAVQTQQPAADPMEISFSPAGLAPMRQFASEVSERVNVVSFILFCLDLKLFEIGFTKCVEYNAIFDNLLPASISLARFADGDLN